MEVLFIVLFAPIVAIAIGILAILAAFRLDTYNQTLDSIWDDDDEVQPLLGVVHPIHKEDN